MRQFLFVPSLVAFCVMAAMAPHMLRAADRYWIGANGFWEQTAHWSATSGGAGGASMPANGDNGFIISSSTLQVTRDNIVPNYSPPGPALLRLGGTGGAVVELVQTAGNNMAATTLDVGYGGQALYSQFSGSNVVTNLSLGNFGTGVGTYDLEAGSLT